MLLQLSDSFKMKLITLMIMHSRVLRRGFCRQASLGCPVWGSYVSAAPQRVSPGSDNGQAFKIPHIRAKMFSSNLIFSLPPPTLKI